VESTSPHARFGENQPMPFRVQVHLNNFKFEIQVEKIQDEKFKLKEYTVKKFKMKKNSS
jgi:hypothetical protein